MDDVEVCPRCNAPLDNESNRLVTDTCGHQKCRQCFLADENGCSDCRTSIPSQIVTQFVITPSCDDIDNAQNEANLIPNHIQKIKTTNGGHQYFCSECGRYFRSRSQQYYHTACGNEQAKQHVCTYYGCNRRFVTRAHLVYHLDSHKSGTYQCSDCSKVFKHPAVLRKHQRNHQLEVVTCKHCQKQFRGNASLNVHMALHENQELPFPCNNCERRYLTKSALQQHILTHSGKRHECPVCHKLYQRNSILQLHMKRHTERECHACSSCPKIFSDTNALARHQKQHNDLSIKYRCTHCDITTVRRDNMLRHVRNMHNGADFQECVEFLEITAIQPLPMTVENSSVIKCIGNVKPVIVPNNEQSVGKDSSIATPTRLTLDKGKQHKKAKYDPIKYYLKILNPDDDETISETENQAHDTEVELQTIDDTNQKPPEQHQHWRKKFKYEKAQQN